MKRAHRSIILAAAGLLLALPAPIAARADGNKNAVTKDVKTSQDYVQLPRMGVPVLVDGTEAYKQLNVELWIYVPNPEIQLKFKPLVSTVADKIRERLKKNPASTYESAEEGPLAVKEIARDVVEDALGKDINEDVLIKKLLLR